MKNSYEALHKEIISDQEFNEEQKKEIINLMNQSFSAGYFEARQCCEYAQESRSSNK